MEILPSYLLGYLMKDIRNQLPECSDLYGTLSYTIQTKDEHCIFYTHSQSVLYSRQNEKDSDYYIYILRKMTKESFMELVREVTHIIPETATLFITGASSYSKTYKETDWVSEFSKFGYEIVCGDSYWIASSTPFYGNGFDYKNYTELSEDYSFVTLTLDHADIIDRHWEFTGPSTLEYIQYLIVQYPSVGITHREDLVCWILTYEYGAIGILYTMEEYRRLGLAKKCMMKLLSILEKKNIFTNMPPFSYICENNTRSFTLHKSLGFEICKNKLISFRLQKNKTT